MEAVGVLDVLYDMGESLGGREEEVHVVCFSSELVVQPVASVPVLVAFHKEVADRFKESGSAVRAVGSVGSANSVQVSIERGMASAELCDECRLGSSERADVAERGLRRLAEFNIQLRPNRTGMTDLSHTEFISLHPLLFSIEFYCERATTGDNSTIAAIANSFIRTLDYVQLRGVLCSYKMEIVT